MPLTFTREFRVRYSELDAYGHVNNAVYLRYMQETAFDASAAVGYDLDRYRALNRIWLIHETDIEYLRPLKYGDTVAVTTWVADFGKVRSRRRYDFHCNGELVACAYSDWAFLDTTTGRPAPIPDELKAAFFPEGESPPTLRREPFPTPPPAPRPFTMRRRVEWRDIDAAGHVNNANYLAFAEECGYAAAQHFGWDPARMWAGGTAVIARRHRLEYHRPAVYGEELTITTWLHGFRAASGYRYYMITRAGDGALVARLNTQVVWVDRQTFKPSRFPHAMLEDFAGHISPAS
ncbi:MAG: thioesterase family protein [Anaerolineales bacterium]|nr:thioesterase family protein [Anaerolineales bacterium]